jgi:predicted NBD/HSP70 family sugar kinase
VNWAAQAECDSGPALSDFTYIFLGDGLGAAVISDGTVIRGHAGFAGEIAHLITVGPQGQAMRLIDVFGALDLRRPGSTAIDADRLLGAVMGAQPQATGILQILARAVSGILAAAVALADSGVVVIGGSWGRETVILGAIAAEAARLPRPIPVRAAALTDEPALTGARTDALNRLRSRIVAAARLPSARP